MRFCARSRRAAEQLLAAATKRMSGDAELAVRYSHPEWIIRAFRDVLGPAELTALLEQDNVPPRVTLAARPARLERAELPGSRRRGRRGGLLERTDPGSLPEVRDGRAGVQDLGSQLMVLALSRATVEGRTTTGWICVRVRVARRDCWRTCSPPTGRWSPWSSTLTGPGWSRRHCGNSRRCRRRRGGCRRGWRFLLPGSTGRTVLRAGVLRRRPESRWRRKVSDIPDLAALQRRLLNHALEVCEPGESWRT